VPRSTEWMSLCFRAPTTRAAWNGRPAPSTRKTASPSDRPRVFHRPPGLRRAGCPRGGASRVPAVLGVEARRRIRGSPKACRDRRSDSGSFRPAPRRATPRPPLGASSESAPEVARRRAGLARQRATPYPRQGSGTSRGSTWPPAHSRPRPDSGRAAAATPVVGAAGALVSDLDPLVLCRHHYSFDPTVDCLRFCTLLSAPRV
jgi:hypothetical protein